MADEADMSSERMEAEEEFRRKQRLAPPKQLQPIGACHWCAELLRFAVFCDEACRDNWKKAEAAKVRNEGVAR